MNKLKNKIKNIDKRIIVIYIVVIVILLIGITYALNNQGISIEATSPKFDIIYSSDFNLKDITLSPILDTNLLDNDDNIIKIDFKVKGSNDNPDIDTIYDIALVDLELDNELKSHYLKWKLVSSTKEIASGDFHDIADNKRLVLTGTQIDLPKYEDNSDEYTFYIWLSDSCQDIDLSKCIDSPNQEYLLNKSLSGRIEVELYTGNKKPKTITLNLDPNGGVLDNEQISFEYGSTYKDLPIPTKEGYTFLGWYDYIYKDNPDLYYQLNNKVSPYQEGDIVNITTNRTIYAGWRQNKEDSN